MTRLSLLVPLALDCFLLPALSHILFPFKLLFCLKSMHITSTIITTKTTASIANKMLRPIVRLERGNCGSCKRLLSAEHCVCVCVCVCV